jgi:tetratricopeptide (TPR) repeat protein
MLAAWSDAELSPGTKVLDELGNRDLEREHQARVNAGLYDDAAALAVRAASAAERHCAYARAAFWTARAADTYRTIGHVQKATAFYERAVDLTRGALRDLPDDVGLQFRLAAVRFGGIVVDSYLRRGAFAEAYQRHETLLREEVVPPGGTMDAAITSDVRVGRLHVRRQQAEMLRCLGRYSEALSMIEAVIDEYPLSAYEAGLYAGLSKADPLRLMGDLESAQDIYATLEY